ncbi:hypothetical protein CL673_08535 [Candidatus Bathyarchaeota archaeon]|nr:hypothetical protein [Candidatus Bathyarchaeota archaeon]
MGARDSITSTNASSIVRNDNAILVGAQAIRTFGFAYLTIILPVHLSRLGFDPITIGLVFTATIGGSAFLTFTLGIVADQIGRKKVLIILSLLTAISGALFASSVELLVILVAAMIGGAGGPGAGIPGGGPYVAVHNALLAGKASDEKRNMIFAVSSAASSLAAAIGSLFSGMSDALQIFPGFDDLGARTALFIFIAILGLSTAVLLIPVREVRVQNQKRSIIPRRSLGTTGKLSLVSGFDGLGTGFLLTPVIAYWFFIRFDVSISTLGTFFFLFSLSTTLAYYIAVRLARYLGSVNTIFFTHMPSTLILFLLPFAPRFEIAAALLILRPMISQIDVPLRQSYMMAISDPEERASVAGIAGMSKTVPSAVSPPIAGYFIQNLTLALPFFAGGILQMTADILFYAFFRKHKPPEELNRSKILKKGDHR